MADTNPLRKIPEALLKKRKQRSEAKIKAQKAADVNKRKQKAKKGYTFRRAESFVREHRKRELDSRRLKKQAKRNSNSYIESESKLAFVVRIRGISGLHPQPRKALQLLHLRFVNNGVFVRLNEATQSLLKIAEPYITWGMPSLKMVRELVYKRGYGRVLKQRVPLTDNAVIEKELGEKDILCMEDLIHEIFTVGPQFKSAANFLWPFKLSTPSGGWKKKYHHFKDGGDYGFRDDKINVLLQRMI